MPIRLLSLAFWVLLFDLLQYSVSSAQSPAQPLTRIAFGSCANQDKPLPIFAHIADLKPELLVLLGDNIYADLDKSKPVTPALIQEKYDTLAKLDGWRRLRATCPILATWDDHDFGKNDGGADWPLKDQSKKLMLDFFNVPAASPVRTRAGVYDAAIIGTPGRRVQVILLDSRYFRSNLARAARPLPGTRIVPYLPNTDADATILGAEQWKWLEEQLAKPADLRLIGSGIQVLADEHPFEKWANVPAERQKLFDVIRRSKANGVVVLSGDRHLGELSLDPGEAIGYPLYDITSSGFNQADKRWRAPEPNKYRVAAMQYGDNFGLVTVDWSEPDPIITLQLRDALGEITARQAFPLSLLKPKAGESATVTAASLPAGVFGPHDMMKKVGEAITVQFPVASGRAVSGGNRILLNSEKDFRSPKNVTVVVNAAALAGKLEKATAATFVGKTIRVKGTVKTFQTQTQIEVNDEKQLEFVNPK